MMIGPSGVNQSGGSSFNQSGSLSISALTSIVSVFHVAGVTGEARCSTKFVRVVQFALVANEVAGGAGEAPLDSGSLLAVVTQVTHQDDRLRA